MNYVDYRFGLDIHEIGSQVFLTVKQGANAQRLRIHLTEAQSPYIIEDGCIAVFAATKSDGKVIFNNCTVEGNEVVYEFTDQTVAALGTMPCEIRLYSGAKLLVSARFTMSVVPTAVQDKDIESVTEVNTLTSLIGEAAQLIADVQLSLDNGEFIPKISVGKVETLPAGSNATVTITGSGTDPVFNFGIPQGEQGQAESLIPDTELSLDSTKPVQNKVITARINTIEKTHSDFAEATTEALKGKVAAENGKGLSSNDFTDELMNKLDGVEPGANNYALPAGGDLLGGVKNGGDVKILEDGAMTFEDGAVNALGAPNFDRITDDAHTINEGDDLNTYTTPGTYLCANSATAKTLTNGPAYTAAGFRLFVSFINTSTAYLQIAIFGGGTSRIYTRQYISGTWRPWTRMMTDVLIENEDYFASESDLPAAGTKGRIAYVKVG